MSGKADLQKFVDLNSTDIYRGALWRFWELSGSTELQKLWKCSWDLSLPREAWDNESELTLFSTFIGNTSAFNCGHKVCGASRGGRPRTQWWPLDVKDAVKLKEYFEELLNPVIKASTKEAGAGDSKVDSVITRAEVTQVVTKLLSGKVSGMENIHPEYLKSLDVVGLCWLTPLQHHVGVWASATGVVVPLFKKGGPEGVSQL